MSATPIADHALLSDSHGSALVTRAGSIDWACFARFDAPAVFARILDDAAGHWSIAPSTDVDATTRRYLDGTLVLSTEFRTRTGVATLDDAFAIDDEEAGHTLGANAPGIIVRRVTCTTGEVRMSSEWAPRPEFGLIRPLLSAVDGGVMAKGGADVLVLSSPLAHRIDGPVARATFDLVAGETVTFATRSTHCWEPTHPAIDPIEATRLLETTIAAWRSWSALHAPTEGDYADLISMSGRVLQALTFRPTGAIVAAPTTSLPEVVGGPRNWDYRYAWVRDASFTLQALRRSACPAEAHHFFQWMADAVASTIHEGEELQIMFGIGGEHDLTERTLRHLSGWRDSGPVRVGNGAWDQRQLDIYGELLDAAFRFADQLDELDDAQRHFLADCADAAASRWKEPDEGIWEVRGGRQHFVYSKLMCWVALDRAIRLAAAIDATERVDDWTATREEIRDRILSDGWSDGAKAFTQAFGVDDLDASVLMMPIVGFVDGDDPRMLATIDAIRRDLTDDRGLVYRYRTSDGLAGDEGTFLLCTFWLAHAEALAGRLADARATFERAVSYANDLGLLSEEVDPGTGELLGNFPQAFSHIGLLNAAHAIEAAEGA